MSTRRSARLLPGRIQPADVFPAGDQRFRTRWLRMRSGDRVRVVESGPEDGRAVVLVPGWGCPAYVFRKLLPVLAEHGYRALSPEPRSSGFADRPVDAAAYSTDAMIAHVVEILDALELDGFALGGHSLGASLAARAAPHVGDRLRALLLLSPVGTHGQPRKILSRIVSPRAFLRLPPRLVSRWVVRLVLRMAAARGGMYSARDIDEYWAASQYPAYAPALLHMLRELDWGDSEPISAEDLQVPTLALYGTKDPLVRRTGAIDKLRRSPRVRVVALRGVGHMVTDEAPDAVNAAIPEFLGSLRAPDDPLLRALR